MTQYPNALDSFPNLVDGTIQVRDMLRILNRFEEGLEAVEAELGVNPSGSFVDLATRLRRVGRWETGSLTAQAIQFGNTAGVTVNLTEGLFFNPAKMHVHAISVLPGATGNRPVQFYATDITVTSFKLRAFDKSGGGPTVADDILVYWFATETVV